jgi:GABA permease
MPVMGGVLTLPAPPEEARHLAQAKLDAALEQMRAAGATVEGEVGDPNPVHAVDAVWHREKFDEIIISTLPARLSRWLHQDLPARLRHKFHVPVTHVGAAHHE